MDHVGGLPDRVLVPHAMPFDGSPKAQAAMVALRRAIYSGF
jgi:hypothetical protein